MTPKQSLAALNVAILTFTGAAQADSAKLVNPNNGHTYQRFDTTKTWNDAKTSCSNLGSHLATITSQQENDWLVLGNFFVAPDTYLGGTDALKNGQWKWVTGESFNYTNWYPGEPGETGSSNSITMAIRNYPQRTAWNDVSETDNYPYLCEWDITAQYLDIITIPDINGDNVADQAVLVLTDGKYYLRIINGASGKQLKSLSLGSATGITFSELTVIPDINGDDVNDFVLLVLNGEKYYLRVIDGVTGNQLRQVSLGAAKDLVPIALTVVDDFNKNGYKDISTLIKKKSDNTNTLQIRDGLMLSILKTFNLPTK